MRLARSIVVLTLISQPFLAALMLRCVCPQGAVEGYALLAPATCGADQPSCAGCEGQDNDGCPAGAATRCERKSGGECRECGCKPSCCECSRADPARSVRPRAPGSELRERIPVAWGLPQVWIRDTWSRAWALAERRTPTRAAFSPSLAERLAQLCVWTT